MESVRLVSLVLTSSLVFGCGSRPGGDDDGAVDGGAGAVIALQITPPSAVVTLAPAGAGYSAQQAFTVIAKYADDTTADVTDSAGFGVDDTEAVTFGGATATVIAAGRYTVTAVLGGVQASALLDAKLDASGFGAGFDPADQGKLDGTPDGTPAPEIKYPLAGALFPVNVAPIAVQVQKSDASQTLARIDFVSGDLLVYHYYAPCTASPNPGAFPNACIVSISGGFAQQLAGVSELADIQLSVRLVAANGTKLSESTPIALAWSKTKLTGGLYYWTTAGAGDTTFNTAIARYDFAGDASTPMIYLSSADAPAVPNGQSQCIGCHAVSPDGTRMAFSLGGSLTGYFSNYDVATKQAVSTQMTDRFAGMSSFSPDGSKLVTMSYGTLTLRHGNASLDTMTTPLFPEVTEQKTHPFWGPSGQKLAFVSWTPTQADIDTSHVTGDMVKGGQIWISNFDGVSTFQTASLLVPRTNNVTSFYPAISDDDNFVVFNQSDCAGPANSGAGAWGAGACDGYNDISATLHLVPATGGTPIALTRANGGVAPLTTNSWPRWSPDHGTFRGKRLYWVAFSSRRGYGLSLASGAGTDTTKPQLWFAAVAVDANGATPTSDPSFAPVWLPGQDPNLAGPRGNHTPAWTSKVVILQ